MLFCVSLVGIVDTCEITSAQLKKPCLLLTSHDFPVNTKYLYNNYTTPAERLRRWSNIA